MKIITPEISWHERDPIYTCAFNPVRKNFLATAGVTGVVRLWETNENEEDKVDAKFVANLKRHTKAVNIVRWNHDGSILASAGDESVILLWNENDIKNQKTLDMDEDESTENWFAFKTLRGHLEDILDLSWSRDGSTLISGSIDNSAILWNVINGDKLAIIKEPKGFVQGVAFDPLGNYFAVMSTDRSLRFYNTSSNKCIFNVNKITINKENSEPQQMRLFHDDTMKSFYRRLCFSFDGNFVVAPAGCIELPDKLINVSFIFTRGCLNKPCMYIPHDKPSNAIAFCPLKFQLIKAKDETGENVGKNPDNLFVLPYRLVFAIATEDSVLLYDTQHLTPFGYVSGIHYSNLTDISWSSDGQLLIVSSIDGFCTFIMFQENELGEEYVSNVENEIPIGGSQLNSQCQQGPPKTPKAEKDVKSEPNRIKTLFSNAAKSVKAVDKVDEIMLVEVQKKPEATTNAKRRIKLVPINT